ncbi:MAG: hypothetical protein A3I26_02275 [Candidatus Yanofskybacteria bacterium RIFCSPLOWO2_02_FULL_43_10]|uniref:Uncharacterized protein n=1 Tax=Candidatus Yanofskybacteria bacterium RIFCSPLOWO2_12_FULL_43_11b TaxID=1802710 RepID=A0A1F8H9M2_9BACT|nr:MAG: hypothetical protein A2742_03740 [Candidatus Yanofskybacteria bacterium RIFCSPHIGHO2_01_FULL_43_32]OGN11109.1 MAG: hypothetical protein A3C69_00280 [Candidatus Yanofskybacteria bacterium RIFCSPHIGHO2_02_FULL_43_12]OGN17229.1 MAG: hypothetical protein A3E34_00010 [Candidatus Yanofskybacteria bacterium RIFCSPHIGHO2_12_FULL_43_11]OGN24960.1 MAG: hypothetical protein A2923_03240 [Candidatus Yanofskybacteria bacterium RIFCSPLOWO2_01_FULL_43_46]OGN30120.1 MAG: hypothetical protein A3I26_02275
MTGQKENRPANIEKFREELRELGFPGQLIEEFVRVRGLGLPEPSPHLYRGLEKHFNFLRENLLLSLVKMCVGRRIGKRFKTSEDAARHMKVCLECKAEIINLTERLKQEFGLIAE